LPPTGASLTSGPTESCGSPTIRLTLGSPASGLEDERVQAASFAPGEDAMVVVVSDRQAGVGRVRIERLALPSGARSILSNEGRTPRWLP
jgi:hypothetical protein